MYIPEYVTPLYQLVCPAVCLPDSSAFFLFCADFRPKVKRDTPGLSIGDTAKRLGEMWNNSSAEDKQPYEKKAAKLKEKYDKVRSEDARTHTGGCCRVYYHWKWCAVS